MMLHAQNYSGIPKLIEIHEILNLLFENFLRIHMNILHDTIKIYLYFCLFYCISGTLNKRMCTSKGFTKLNHTEITFKCFSLVYILS